MMAKRIAVAGIALLSGIMITQTTQAQTNLDGTVETVTTAVPFLRISPDARSGAMGDVGIALSPDANGQYWNVGKIAASDKVMGLSVTYTPWLKDLVPDIFLGYLSGYVKFGKNYDQALSTSLRYFNLGNIDYTTINAEPAGTGKPREFAWDLGYSRRLSTDLSLGVSLRYVNSNIAAGSNSVDGSGGYRAANVFGADVGLYYSTLYKLKDEESGGAFSAGAVASNIGSKVSYSQTRKDFQPANLGLGAAYTHKVDKYNKITAALDLNKILVPAPVWKTNSQGVLEQVLPDQSVVSGIFSSFSKAPKGYGTTVSIGGEYVYQDMFAARAGYFYETPENGHRQYFTVGLGVKYNVFGLDFSYLIPSGSSTARNPLSNTLRFSLLFDFDSFDFSKDKDQ